MRRCVDDVISGVTVRVLGPGAQICAAATIIASLARQSATMRGAINVHRAPVTSTVHVNSIGKPLSDCIVWRECRFVRNYSTGNK